ncbi:MAG: DUF2785 domain-containing protein [Chloroflexi bacterium]|nr:DUF2785 domain-containing protein [Chloroflexota bacterium]
MGKPFWQAIIDSDYAIPQGYSVGGLTPELVSYLGSTDPDLRDEIAYSVMSRWVINGLYTPADLRLLIDTFAANLTRGIGEMDTDTVFLRSFSVLMLAASVYYDNHKQPYLNEQEVRSLFEQTLAYFSAEKDVRGFVPGKGWAHSCAHTADLLDEFALHRFMTAADLDRILNAFADKVMAQSGVIYLYSEDDRMSFAALSALKRERLTREQVAAWFNRMGGLVERLGRANIFADPALLSAYHNTKNFLRSLTLRLENADLPEAVRLLATDGRAALKRF